MKRCKEIIDKLLIIFTGGIIISMVLLVLWQIYARYILQEPFTSGEETIRLLLIWLAICGGSYAFGSNSHLALDILNKTIKPQQRIYLDIFLHILILIFAASVLLIGGVEMVNLTKTQVTPALQIPVSFLYLSMPIGGIIIIYYEIYHIYLLKKLILDKEEN